MTTAALIPLHTQVFINELLLEEREPRGSVKHTQVFLTTLAQRTHSSLSAVGHQGWNQSQAVVPLVCGKHLPPAESVMLFSRSKGQGNWSWNRMTPAIASTSDICRYEQIGSVALPGLNPATWEPRSYVLHPVQLTSNRKWGLRRAPVGRGWVTWSGTSSLHTRSRW